MLWTIAVILLILWLLGIVSSYTMGGLYPYFAGDRRYRSGAQYHSGPESPVDGRISTTL